MATTNLKKKVQGMMKKATEERKTKLINRFSSADGDYGHSGLDFGMVCTVEGDDDSVELVAAFKPCRDYLHDVIRCQLHGGKDWYSSYDGKKDKPVSLDKFRLVLGTSLSRKNKVHAALTAINILEDAMGIEDKMRLTLINEDDKGYRVLMEGDPLWFSDPHLMSIISLITRWTILRVTSIPDNLSGMGIEELLEWFKVGAKDNGHSDVINYMPSFLKRADTIIKHYKEIFHLPVEEAYPNFERFSRDDYHSKGGIHELCNYHSGMKEIESVIKKLEKEKTESAGA